MNFCKIFLLLPLIVLLACSGPRKTTAYRPATPRPEVKRPSTAINTPRTKSTNPSSTKTPGNTTPRSARAPAGSVEAATNLKSSAAYAVYRDIVIRKSREYLGARYRYGGTDKKGFDCSGFTSCVFREAGMSIPRTSRDQARFGEKKKITHAIPGDLIFFGHGSSVDHVGIILHSTKEEILVIHSTNGGGVQIDNVLEVDYWRRRMLWATNPYDDLLASGTK